MSQKFTIGVVVTNHFGVLNRVAGLYAKRCYNIDSLAVGETENPNYSRITIVSTGDDYMKEQAVKQLRKLHDVKMVALLEKENSVSVEHMLIKIKANSSNNKNISDIINTYGGKVMDFSHNFITAEITGSSEKIDDFIRDVKEIGIIEVCRSGAISLAYGNENNVLSVEGL